MPIKATDQWLLLYMVHSAVPQPQTVYITYEVDFVPEAKAEALDLKPAYPMWLDVRPSGYPVFNVQRAFGGDDGTCTWPKEQCASFDPYGKEITGQGQPGQRHGQGPARSTASQFGGQDFKGGTLIGIGGHLHPGGLTNDIDLVRGDDAQTDLHRRGRVLGPRPTPTKPGGPPNSWDFSMKVIGLPVLGRAREARRRHAQQRDLRHDASSPPTRTWASPSRCFVPNDADGNPQAPGRRPVRRRARPVGRTAPRAACRAAPTLCDKGVVTHGHLAENDNFGGPERRRRSRPSRGQATPTGSTSPTSSTRRATCR